VETEAQASALRALHCDYLQGYLISKPLDEEALLAWLAGNQPG
jgi:EAL domain-containing protein (putative c-di-GMP-specific phosphodiesterase class I)